MPTIFRTGGGGVPQWNVYTGLTAPPVKENGLWVALDINIHNVNLVFGTSRPENPADKTLYIAYTSKDNMPLAKPLRNVDEISYHIVSAVWYTTAGGWTGMDLYVVKDGAWVLHNKGEYYLYVKSANNLLSKITEAGDTVWTITLPCPYSYDYALITDMAIDNVNGVAYVLQCVNAYLEGNDKTVYKVTKISTESGSVIATYPSDSSWSSAGSYVKFLGRIFITPDRENVVVTSGKKSANGKNGASIKFGADLGGVLKVSSNDIYVGDYPAMRNNAKLRSMTFESNASGNVVISELDTTEWSTNIIKNIDTSNYQYPYHYTLTSGESIFGSTSGATNMHVYLNDGTVITNAWSDLINGQGNTAIKTAIELPNGTFVMALSGTPFKGLWFVNINKSTGALAEVKRISHAADIYNMVVTPAGTIYCASNSMVYRVNADDTLMEVANTMVSAASAYNRSFLACDPCDRLTFPEYFS